MADVNTTCRYHRFYLLFCTATSDRCTAFLPCYKNIIANLGTDHFMRVKVGVGEKPKNWDLADYVLSPFTKDERPLVNLAIEHAAKAIEQMLNGDVDAAMNEYNRKSANPAE